MEITNRYKRVALDQIIVDREGRQRQQDLSVDDLVGSIKQFGVLNPVIVTKDFQLIAGERRYIASKTLGLLDIPCRFVEDLSLDEAKTIELEENLKRKDLHWRDYVKAIGELHSLYEKQTPGWTQTGTSERLGIVPGSLSLILRVYRNIDDPKIAGAPNHRAAYNMLSRVDARGVADVMSSILETTTSLFGGESTPAAPPPPDPFFSGGTADRDEAFAPPPPPVPPPAPESLLQVDFLEWAPQYTGRPFNFIHCDFPYGINAFAGPQSGRDKWTTYNDDPDVYWQLIRCLCKHLDKLMSHSAHLMFWLAGDIEIQYRTLDTFRQLAPGLQFNTYPLIWLKSDNVGILPDPKRGPRRIYETALFAAREDRLILKAVSNAYAAPTNKDFHPSTKPEPVLRHFMSMFVDENTRLLDPTCGGGSALRAAESLGACSVLGLEREKEHFESAKSALRAFRALRAATKKG
jgi:ParB family transcriptional regulator, chromosome partitioning protein